jgi:hypothetical protein
MAPASEDGTGASMGVYRLGRNGKIQNREFQTNIKKVKAEEHALRH